MSPPRSPFKLRTGFISLNETLTDIKDSKFVDRLCIDWPVAKQQYATKADVVWLSYRD